MFPLWGITDDTCFFGMCYACKWIGEVRAIFEEAESDVEAHRERVEPPDML